MHEHFKDVFGKLVTAITDDLRIDCRSAGETTWKRPDDCTRPRGRPVLLLSAEKLAKDRDAVKRRSRNIADYPNPDLPWRLTFPRPRSTVRQSTASCKLVNFGDSTGNRSSSSSLGADGKLRRYRGRVGFSEFEPTRCRDGSLEENADDPSAWRDRLRAWNQTVLGPRRQNSSSSSSGMDPG